MMSFHLSNAFSAIRLEHFLEIFLHKQTTTTILHTPNSKMATQDKSDKNNNKDLMSDTGNQLRTKNHVDVDAHGSTGNSSGGGDVDHGPPPSKKSKTLSASPPGGHGGHGLVPTTQKQNEGGSTKRNGGNDVGTKQKGNKKNKRRKTKDIDPAIVEIRRIIQLACRDNNLNSAIEAYRRAKKESITIEAQSYYSLLNLCDGVTSKHRHGTTSSAQGGSSSKKDVVPSNNNHASQPQTEQLSSEERMEFAFQVRDDMKSMNLPLNETAYSALVKVLSKRNEFDHAEALLDEAELTQQCKPKLRLYSSLLLAYCESGQMQRALMLWKRMVTTKVRLEQQREKNSLTANNTSMDLTEREYNALMQCATHKHHPSVMEHVLSELAEEIPVPAKDTVDTILKWFQDGNAANKQVGVDSDDGTRKCHQLIQDLIVLQYGNDDAGASNEKSIKENQSSNGHVMKERPPNMGPVVFPDDAVTDGEDGGDQYTWEISPDCHIDTKTGTLTDGCLKGLALRPVPLSERALQEMKDMNTSIVFEGNVAGNICEFQGGRKGKKRNKGNASPNKRQHDWRNFNNFLKRSRKGWDVVIDGANVGYYQQNFATAPKHVDYEKIDWIVQHFRRSSKETRILLVMHTRHFSRDMLPQQYLPIVDSWRRDGILYQTPFGMNDDWLVPTLFFSSSVCYTTIHLSPCTIYLLFNLSSILPGFGCMQHLSIGRLL